MQNYADLMFTDTIQALQAEAGTRDRYQKFYVHRTSEAFSDDERAFIESRESVYIASVSNSGWPYIQHRGGTAGFLKVLGPTRLACADYKGNQQFITQGNLADDARVSVFFMDYVNKARMKVQGHARLTAIADADPDVTAALDLSGPAERVLVIDVIARDWNCPKYIPELYPADVVQAALAKATAPLLAEIDRLNAQLNQEDT